MKRSVSRLVPLVALLAAPIAAHAGLIGTIDYVATAPGLADSIVHVDLYGNGSDGFLNVQSASGTRTVSGVTQPISLMVVKPGDFGYEVQKDVYVRPDFFVLTPEQLVGFEGNLHLSHFSIYGFGLVAGDLSLMLTGSSDPTIGYHENAIPWTGTGESRTISGISVQAVPEPASMVALGLGGAALIRRRKRG